MRSHIFAVAASLLLAACVLVSSSPAMAQPETAELYLSAQEGQYTPTVSVPLFGQFSVYVVFDVDDGGNPFDETVSLFGYEASVDLPPQVAILGATLQPSSSANFGGNSTNLLVGTGVCVDGTNMPISVVKYDLILIEDSTNVVISMGAASPSSVGGQSPAWLDCGETIRIPNNWERTVTINPTGGNQPPIAVDDQANTVEEVPVIIDVLANDDDPDGDPFFISAFDASTPSTGTVTAGPGPGELTYMPATDYFGAETFSYTIDDGNGGSATATVFVTVVNVNDPPIPTDDNFAVNEDTSFEFSDAFLLANDTDFDGPGLGVGSVASTSSAGGVVVDNLNGTYTYAPPLNYFGPDTIQYEAIDGAGGSAFANINVTVNPVNDPPVANIDNDVTDEDVPFTTINVLLNDDDVDNDILSVDSADPVSAAGGSVVNNADGTFFYTPPLDYNGLDVFAYVVTDGNGAFATTDVHITLTPVNDDPVANEDADNTNEDTPFTTVDVLANDTDVDDDPLTVISFDAGSVNGAVINHNGDGTFNYSPPLDFFGQDSFGYVVGDANGGFANGLVTVSVAPVNDPPVANPDAFDTAEDVSILIDSVVLLANDFDIDSSSLTVILVNPVSVQGGIIVDNLDGTYTYTPPQDFFGLDSFGYDMDDGDGGASSSVVDVTVSPVNDAPVAVPDAFDVPEDSEDLPLDVLANDFDVDSPFILDEVDLQTAQGGRAVLGVGVVLYSPPEDYFGPDSFSYRINDGEFNIVTQVDITVTPVNDPPFAADDVASTMEDVVIVVDVLANDLDIDDGVDPGTVSVVSPPTIGTVTNVNPVTGEVTYEPLPNVNGIDTFQYRVFDFSSAPSNVATVTVTIGAGNDPPVGNPDVVQTDEDVPIAIEVLANDTDIDGNLDPSTLQIVGPPANGIANLTPLFEILYTPAPDFNGTDLLTYEVFDALGESTGPVSVDVTVTPVNDPPGALDDAASTTAGVAVDIDILANDSDVDGFLVPDSVVLVESPSFGGVVFNPNDGVATYTPAAGQGEPEDSFRYHVLDDGGLPSNAALVTITINMGDDDPTAIDDQFQIAEDEVATLAVTANDIDDTGIDHETVTIVSPPSQGEAVSLAGGDIEYTPNANFNGNDTLTYTVADVAGNVSNEALVTIIVDPADDAPVAVDDAYSVEEDTTLDVDAANGVLANDFDVDGDGLFAVLDGPPSHGTVEFSGNGAFQYFPDPDFDATDQFTYHVVANDVSSQIATVVITVGPQPEAWTDITSGPEGDDRGDMGVVWGYADSGHLPDVYLPVLFSPSMLLLNDGNNQFVDATVGDLSGIQFDQSATFGDADNDGDDDLLVGAVQGSKLFRNDGGGAFTEVDAGEVGIANTTLSVSFVDADNDGLIDIYLGNVLEPNQLFQNLGNFQFADVTPPELSATTAETRVVTWADVNGDGLQYLFEGNRNGPNRLFQNLGDFQFLQMPISDDVETYGAAFGDIDNDTDPDLLVTNDQGPNQLFRNDGGFNFVNIAVGPLALFEPSRGCAFADTDNDGDLDIFLSNLLMEDRLLRNEGNNVFVDVTIPTLADPRAGMGMAFADSDHDGDQDLLLAIWQDTNVFYRNELQELGSTNAWLHVDLVGIESNAGGVGAEVFAHTNGDVQMRSIESAMGMASQNSRTAEFGFGPNVSSIDRVEVRWPSGKFTQLLDVQPNRHITIVEDEPHDGYFNAWTLQPDTGEVYSLNVERPLAVSVGVGGFDNGDARVQLATGADASTIHALTENGTLNLKTYDVTIPSLVTSIDLDFATLPGLKAVGGLSRRVQDGKLYTTVLDLAAGIEYLSTVDLSNGLVRLESELELDPDFDTPGALQTMAFAPSGLLYATEQLASTSSSQLWQIDPLTRSGEMIGVIPLSIGVDDDITFLGDELWVMGSSAVGNPTLYQIEVGNGTSGSILQTKQLVNNGLRGITGRDCTDPDSPLIASDSAQDRGGNIDLDWTAYVPPANVASYDILRVLDACDVFDPATPVHDSTNANNQTFRDVGAPDFVVLFYGVRVVLDDGSVEAVLVSNSVIAGPDILINEFAPSGLGPIPKGGMAKIGEPVELFNNSMEDIDLAGFRLSNGIDDEEISGVIPAGGFLVWTLVSIDLPDAGGTLQLLPPTGSNFVIDEVSYGTEGGTATVPAGFTISRTGGTSEDPDSETFNISQPTLGDPNEVADPALGSSLVFNEIFYNGEAGQDYIEIINPQGNNTLLEGFAIGDGTSFVDTLTSGVELGAGDLLLLDTSSADVFNRDITSQTMYLYQITETGLLQIVDQIGWGPGPVDPPAPDASAPNEALVRAPDGVPSYLGDQGANWLESGGGVSLFYGPPTPGGPNVTETQVVIFVSAAGDGDFLTINEALAIAPPGTRILVDPGIYTENIVLKSGVEVVGGTVAGAEIVIQGDGFAPAVSADGVDETAVLSGVVVRGGSPGLSVVAGSPTISFVRFEENHNAGDGGAVSIVATLPKSRGGAPLRATVASDVAPNFDGCTFERNTAQGDGGAILNLGGNPSFESCLFWRNDARQNGGVIFSTGGDVAFEGCVFDMNGSYDDFGIPGVMHATAGQVDVTFSVLSNSMSGAPIRASGSTIFNFGCGGLYNHPEPLVSSDGGLSLTNITTEDPEFCQPLAKNYAYTTVSPLLTLPTTCNKVVGVTGPPCATKATGEMPVPRRQVNVLHPPVPNPFNPSTQLRFELANKGTVHLDIYDVRGRRVKSLIGGEGMEAGPHEIIWQGRDHRGAQVASGVYLARLRLDGKPVGKVQRMVLLK